MSGNIETDYCTIKGKIMNHTAMTIMTREELIRIRDATKDPEAKKAIRAALKRIEKLEALANQMLDIIEK